MDSQKGDKIFTPSFLKLGSDAEKAQVEAQAAAKAAMAQIESAAAQKAKAAAAAALKKHNLDQQGNEVAKVIMFYFAYA